MIIPGLLTNLCRTELADSISVSEPGAVGDSAGRGGLEGKSRGSARGTALCFTLI